MGSLPPLRGSSEDLTGTHGLSRGLLSVAPLALLFLLMLFCAGILRAASFTEDFSTAPASRGWKTFGDTNLFQWNAATGALAVTWDSSRSNSYYRRPLGTILSMGDDFTLDFDLRLDDIAIGLTEEKPYTFQLAIGFHNSLAATNATFRRGTGSTAPHLVEFNYFPDSGFGATIWPAFVDGAGKFNYDFSNPGSAFTIREMTTNVLYRVTMAYTASNRTMRTTMTADGVPFGPINNAVLLTNFGDYRVDMVSISSYSDTGADGSVLAHGWVDNVNFVVPDAPVSGLAGQRTNGLWRAEFVSRTNWIYTLERSGNLSNWRGISVPASGNGGVLFLTETNVPMAGMGFYRVRAERP